MSTILLVAVTASVFLVLDGLMLAFVMAPLFATHIGPLMAEPLRLGPAAVFYAGYVGGLIWLVSRPALREGRPVVAPAAVVGAMAYGTYELTSYAILRDWDPSMVAADMVWGTALTAIAAWVGVAAARRWG